MGSRLTRLLFVMVLVIALCAPSAAWGARPPSGGTGTIQGTVMTESRAPIAGATVSLWSYNAKTRAWSQGGQWYTGATGTYALTIAPGTYRIQFSASGQATKYFDNASTFDSATSIVLAAGDSRTADCVFGDAFVSTPLAVTQSGLDASLTWGAGNAPYTVWRSPAADWSTAVALGTTSNRSWTDSAPFRTSYHYSVTDAAGRRVVSGPLALAAGSGTIADPFLVRQLEDLANVATHGGAAYCQIADIDASPTSDPSSKWWNGGAGWTPIGWNGVYDGGGHAVSGLYSNQSWYNNGLFGTGQLTVRNLRLVDVDVTGGQFTGALVGWLQPGSLIDSCTVSGKITGWVYVGGLAGRTHFSEVTKSRSWATVICTADEAGGLIGEQIDGTVSKCAFFGSVDAVNSEAGGIVGRMLNDEPLGADAYPFVEMRDCYSLGTVSGYWGVGGLVGRMYQGVLKNSFAAGPISLDAGGSFASGLVGYAYEPQGDYNNFFDVSTTGQTVGAGGWGMGTGLPTDAMQSTETYVGWDFGATWYPPVAATRYPELRYDGSVSTTTTGVLMGTITRESGGVLSSATVTAYSYNARKALWQAKAQSITGSNGTYSITLPAGTYRLGVARDGYLAEYFDEATSVATAKDIVVPAAMTQRFDEALTTTFYKGGLLLQQQGLDAVLTWTASGTGPYTIKRSKNADMSQALVVGTTTSSTFADAPSFRTAFYYSVTDSNGETLVKGPITLVGGDGSAANPFLVRTLEDLDAMLSSPASHFLQIADIDASPTSDPSSPWWRGGAGWRNVSMYFTGSYDGGGHSVSGLYMRTQNYGAGLISHTAGAVIKNLRLLGVDIGGARYAGGVTGQGKATITNVMVTGSVSGYECVGGIAGDMRDAGTRIESCTTDVVVTAQTGDAGGIVGMLFGYYGVSAAVDCTASGSVYASYRAGGICGDSEMSAIISGCYSNATVTAATRYAGGIVGQNNATVDQCVSAGTVSAGDRAGGIAGTNNGSITRSAASGSAASPWMAGGIAADSNGSITDCYSNVLVSGSGGYYGGIVGGSFGSVTRCLATGPVYGASYAGGVCGADWGTTTDSYWDVTTTAQATSQGGEGKATLELQLPATYVNWDFLNVWNEPVPGLAYPTLR